LNTFFSQFWNIFEFISLVMKGVSINDLVFDGGWILPRILRVFCGSINSVKFQ
jgi:hypothetical protein